MNKLIEQMECRCKLDVNGDVFIQYFSLKAASSKLIRKDDPDNAKVLKELETKLGDLFLKCFIALMTSIAAVCQVTKVIFSSRILILDKWDNMLLRIFISLVIMFSIKKDSTSIF